MQSGKIKVILLHGHHKGRNKHHLEYWLDYDLENGGIKGMKMPVKYVVEMFCDRIAASKNYNRDTYRDDMPLQYYKKGKGKQPSSSGFSTIVRKTAYDVGGKRGRRSFCLY